MKVNLPNGSTLALDSSNDDLYHYLLVSKRWTVQNDSNITFVRKNALGYCYNLEWAGPLTKYEALKLSSSSTSITIISIAKIRPFLKTINDKIYLPNTTDVRKALGIDNDEVQFAY
ncbi:hypothetical protein DNC80_02945 [Flavobacterium sp. SOK18b]|uniref:hypothetical protein n=1 Tax=Flavobacterium sp. SOK18b TaxID=797900 RepID=UPI0015FCEF68|nr:hypothetical protein [Flavobacterium sp. SOK18b]MBB1192624.1 hypothetical protein [Flavobacterium sp. SOK18b]